MYITVHTFPKPQGFLLGSDWDSASFNLDEAVSQSLSSLPVSSPMSISHGLEKLLFVELKQIVDFMDFFNKPLPSTVQTLWDQSPLQDKFT